MSGALWCSEVRQKVNTHHSKLLLMLFCSVSSSMDKARVVLGFSLKKKERATRFHVAFLTLEGFSCVITVRACDCVQIFVEYLE